MLRVGTWQYKHGTLQALHIQPDPYAPPSRFRLHVPHSVAKFPEDLYSNFSRWVCTAHYSEPVDWTKILRRSTALCDYLARRVHQTVTSQCGAHRHDGSSKAADPFVFDEPGQQILQRSSVYLNKSGIEVRFGINLPAQGKTRSCRITTSRPNLQLCTR